MKGKLSGYPLVGIQKIPPYKIRLLRVIDAWDYMNDLLFNGEMARPKIVVWAKLHMVVKGKRYDLRGAYDPKKHQIWLLHGDKDSLETMFHEMIHQYLAEVLGESETAHGALFWEVYNEKLELLSGRL
jgi:hypothetical protein